MKGIIERYLKLHSELGTQKDAPDKEIFDTVHRQIWGACDIELEARLDDLRRIPKPNNEEKQELSELEHRFEYIK